MRSPRVRRLLILALALLALLPGLLGVRRGSVRVLRGVNDAGGEFWKGRAAARTDPYSSAATPAWVGARGLGLIRLPFAWERMQPTPGGDLDAAEVGFLRRYLADAATAGVKVVVEPHNGARYTLPDGRVVRIGEEGCSVSQFADFWARMARALGDAPALQGYGLMNEPANMPTVLWKEASQRALQAIRAVGDRHLVLVPGNNYASAQVWVACHGRRAWIVDPADNFAYEAHVYLDLGGDGRYDEPSTPRADPELLDRGPQRLRGFVEWCRENHVRGFVGELGVPAEPGWMDGLDRTLDYLDREHVDATLWAAGERWPVDYKLSLQPRDGVDRPQMEVLLRHRGGSTGSIGHDFLDGYVQLWRDLRSWLARVRGSARVGLGRLDA